MIGLMVKTIKAGPQDKLFTATDDEDFVMAALPANAATKELGS